MSMKSKTTPRYLQLWVRKGFPCGHLLWSTRGMELSFLTCCNVDILLYTEWILKEKWSNASPHWKESIWNHPEGANLILCDSQWKNRASLRSSHTQKLNLNLIKSTDPLLWYRTSGGQRDMWNPHWDVSKAQTGANIIESANQFLQLITYKKRKEIKKKT